MGAPRLHEFLKENFQKWKIQSILLDFDERFHMFYRSDVNAEFLHYNMFNNYFFGGEQARRRFEAFLRHLSENDRCCLFTDPPFGCRTEVLAYTLDSISKLYKQVNNFQLILPIIWVFPYYMENYVQTSMPSMEMLDYKINYTNHTTYHAGEKGRKQGSPVRIYTNIPLHLIELPASEGYRFCVHCKRWVANENLHCSTCRKCPSKNGDTYVHCNLCAVCVKPNYKHCQNCGRCTQKLEHSCLNYQKNLTCAICRVKGHNEMNCLEWFKVCGKNMHEMNKFKKKAMKLGKRICFICFKTGHNERYCEKRAKLLKEYSFMNNTYNILNECKKIEK